MPWNECSVMEERMRFILRRLDSEAMSDLCREFGISRKTAKTPEPQNVIPGGALARY